MLKFYTKHHLGSNTPGNARGSAPRFGARRRRYIQSHRQFSRTPRLRLLGVGLLRTDLWKVAHAILVLPPAAAERVSESEHDDFGDGDALDEQEGAIGAEDA